VLIAKADPICARTNVKLSSTTVKSNQELARVLPQVAAYERAEAAELSNLVPPASMASDWNQIVIGIRIFSEDTEKAATNLQSGNSATASGLYKAAKKVQDQLAVIAKRNGFKQCGTIA